MTLPTVVLVGKPNVGKSTLYNSLTKTRDAIVGDYEGLTHDRKIGSFDYNDKTYSIIDCGGIVDKTNSNLEQGVQSQVAVAIKTADLILFVIDAKHGITSNDYEVAQKLRKTNKQIMLVVNKIDGENTNSYIAESTEMGITATSFISALKNRGIKQLQDKIAAILDSPANNNDNNNDNNIDNSKEKSTYISIIGRPNVGKSTLINTIIKEQRLVVSETPGTTRDRVEISFKNATIVDTAGIRRKSSITEAVEKFSIVKAIEAINKSDVVLIVLDCTESYVSQDLRLMKLVLEKGCALIVILNKIDCISKLAVKAQVANLKDKLQFAEFLNIIPISALKNQAISKVQAAIKSAKYVVKTEIATSKLTNILQAAVLENPPPTYRRAQIKMRYAHLGSSKTRTVIIHGNNVDKLPDNYQKYLQRFFRKHLQLPHSPILFEFKSNTNPYSHKKNILSHRQKQKRYRMLKYHKS